MSYDIELRMQGPLFERDLGAAVDREISAELVELAGIGQRLVVHDTPRGATGHLRGSVLTELRGQPGARGAAVTTSVFYAPIVERGRRPGKQPPLAPLIYWVTRKLGITDERQARGIAFVIARKIARVGSPGAGMFFKAWQRLLPIAEQRWQALGERLRRRLGGE